MALLTPLFGLSSFQSCKTINICCIIHSVFGILSWKPRKWIQKAILSYCNHKKLHILLRFFLSIFCKPFLYIRKLNVKSDFWTKYYVALSGGPFLNDLVLASVGAGKCRRYWNQDLKSLCFAAFFFLNSRNFSVHPVLMDFPERRDICIFLKVAL